MDRIPFTGDDKGEWFDRELARAFEARDVHGPKLSRRTTHSQSDHETIYYTRTGRWVVSRSSEERRARPTYTQIELAEAAQWLVAHGWKDHANDLPAVVRTEVTTAAADRET